MPKLEIHKVLVLSTTHVSEETAAMIDAAAAGRDFPFAPEFSRNEGWMFYCYKPDEVDLSKRPADLVKVMEFARACGCQWVMFDRDGDTVDGLPIYEW